MAITWCKNCNLPLVGIKCGGCGKTGEKIRFLGREPYPALGYHRAIINKLLEKYGIYIPEDEFILLTETWTSAHKALWEKYYKVIVQGIDLGGYYFDPWKLEYAGEFNQQALKEFRERRNKIKPFNSYEEMLAGLVKANINYLNETEGRSKQFILKEVKRSKKAAVVLFSGGRDSRVALSLALEALGKDLYILFSDTGAEVPATKDYIHNTISEMGMQDRFFITSAKQAFQDRIEKFGPPAGDFQWCCKVFKVGPVGSSLKEKFPKGCIALWGLRMGESVYRIVQPIYWDNFTNQLTALPIITWSKIDEYLYLYKYKINLSPSYELGLSGTACYMCPVNLEYFHIIKKKYPDLWNGWEKFLQGWSESYNLPKSWIRYNLWRYTRVPKGIIQALEAKGVDASYLEGYYRQSLPELFTSYSERMARIGHRKEILQEDLEFSFVGGISPCTPTEYSIEGFFNKPIDFEKSLNLLTIFGEYEYEKSLNLVKLKRKSWSILLFGEGKFKIISRDLSIKKAEKILKIIKEIIWRNTYCSVCGLCVSRCPHNALVLNQKVEVIENRCTHCLDCLKCYCPTNNLRKLDMSSRINAIFKYINLSPNWDLKGYTQKETFKSKILNITYKFLRVLAVKLGGKKFIYNKILRPSINFIIERRIKSK